MTVLFFDRARRSATGGRPTQPSTTPLHLTRRGDLVLSFAIILGVFFVMWGAAALGFWITGVEG